MTANIRVGIVQHNPVVGDIAGNAETVAQEYAGLSESDPDIVVTPELSLVGYPPRDLLHRPGVLDAQVAALDALAEQTTDGPPLVVGIALRTGREAGRPVHNAAVLLREGGQSVAYHKRLLPTYDVFDEHRYFQPGTDPVLATIDGVEVGLTICEDAWHDTVVTGTRRHETNPLQETADAGADVILTLSASPFSLDKPARREQRFLAHADGTGCPVVFANQVGGNDELLFDGHSFVVADGAVRARLAGFRADTGVVEIPVDGEHGHALPDYSSDRPTQARKALTLGLRDYFRKTGFEEAVVGLSGGIDSSVAATLATEALGPANVYGVSLPSSVTSEQSVADAQAVAENLGIDFDVIPVEAAVEATNRALEENGTALTGVAAENIQARIRGDVLMGLANQRESLVITPDNKSESAVGYCTLYGDTVGALAPLGDCYKRLVYDLAAAFNSTPPETVESPTVIPQSVVDKEPTAELRQGQRDAEELPPYEQLDPVLAAYIEGNEEGSELRERYPADIVERALGRVTGAEFKRRQTPPPLRITQKALGRGWNYPVAAAYDPITDPDTQ